MIVYLEIQKEFNRVCIYLDIKFLYKHLDFLSLIKLNTKFNKIFYRRINLGQPFMYINFEDLPKYLQE